MPNIVDHDEAHREAYAGWCRRPGVAFPFRDAVSRRWRYEIVGALRGQPAISYWLDDRADLTLQDVVLRALG